MWRWDHRVAVSKSLQNNCVCAISYQLLHYQCTLYVALFFNVSRVKRGLYGVRNMKRLDNDLIKYLFVLATRQHFKSPGQLHSAHGLIWSGFPAHLIGAKTALSLMATHFLFRYREPLPHVLVQSLQELQRDHFDSTSPVKYNDKYSWIKVTVHISSSSINLVLCAHFGRLTQLVMGLRYK